MNKRIQKVLIVLLGIGLNVLGRKLASAFQLPIWFDMVGTFIASYYAGLWGGIIAGIFNNLLTGFTALTDMAYALTSIIAASVIYLFAKRGYMDSLLKAVVSTFWLGIVCTIVSTPINLFLYDGYSGNVWGDTLVDMLRWHNAGNILSSLAGDGVVEIIDKQICVLAAYFIILGVRKYQKKKNALQKAGAVFLAAVVVISALGHSFPVLARENTANLEQMVAEIYDNTNGMVASEANTICETEDGYIWIGSYAGLSRYDGKHFEFIREGGLVNVVSMLVDSRGRLWIGTNDSGIARYENGTYTYFSMEDGLPSNSIRSFAEDSQGNIYVGTTDKICRFSQEDSISVIEQDILFAKYMTVYQDMLIVLDNTGVIYAIDEEKTIKLDNKSEGYFYYCLASTSRGVMVGTDTGELFILDVSKDRLGRKMQLPIEASSICTLFEDSRQRLWIALDTGFGYMEENNTFHKMYYEEFPSSIDCFLEDYQGNIWMASSNYGVMKLSESSFCNLFDIAGSEGGVVNAVLYYQGNYYCGMDDGLVIMDGSSYKIKENELTALMKGNRVRCLFEDNGGNLWIGSYSGLYCYQTDGSIRNYTIESDAVTSNRFRCMTQLADGSVVAGTADGINYFKNGRLTRTVTGEDGLNNTQILSIVAGEDGNVLAGSDGSGIYVLSEEGLVKNYTVKDGLSSDIVLRIVPYEEGYFVVTSNALCHMDLQGNIKKLSSFPYFNNYDVLIHEDTAYVTCSAGLYEVKLSELCQDEVSQFALYNADQGLLSGLTANSWNYEDANGKMYLCSNSGVILFNKENNRADTNLKFGISNVDCDGEKLLPSEEHHYVVPRDVQNISIYASIRNYAFMDVKVRFFIRELEDNPGMADWDEVEPIQLLKSDFSKYHICLQILNNTGETVLQEEEYILEKEMHTWQEPVYQAYLWSVCTEIFFFTIISIVGMILFIIRKNELEKNKIELEKQVQLQTRELSNQQKKIQEMFTRTVTALGEAVDAKDRYTSGHSKRVAGYARMIAEKMGKTKEQQEEIYRAGLLHDIGKIRVPAEIINKPGKLTDEEYNIIKIHPVTGFHILRDIAEDNSIAIGAKYHHERYDGNGYPNGLEGDKIPEIARILAVADAYDAMASNRSYRNALPQEVVRAEIEKCKGTQFDPKIADIMLEMMDEDKEYRLRQMEATEKYILVVDDEAINIKIIKHIMKDEPMYTVVSAHSGQEALDKMKLQKFDLILLDLRMPEMDGIETLKLIRESYKTPVVMMTADRTLDTTAEFAQYDCDDYITKPVLPLLLKEVVHNMIEKHIGT